MTFLEALYGSQYYEIRQQGKDGNKGRLNGNLFLSAMIVLAVIAVMMGCTSFIPGLNERFTGSIQRIFGSMSGRSIGKLLAIPLFAIIYFIIKSSVGNQQNFQAKVDTFMQYPEEVKKKANAKLLIPFFILLGIVIVLAFSK